MLNAGIDVFTTINIQHIESMVDVVQQVSGIKISETVPDRILAEASEVELVDLTPKNLLNVLKKAKFISPKSRAGNETVF